MLRRLQHQLHIHPIWTPTKDELRNAKKKTKIPKQLHRINDRHIDLWRDQESNDR